MVPKKVTTRKVKPSIDIMNVDNNDCRISCRCLMLLGMWSSKRWTSKWDSEAQFSTIKPLKTMVFRVPTYYQIVFYVDDGLLTLGRIKTTRVLLHTGPLKDHF